MSDALHTSNLPPAAIALIKEGSSKPQTAVAALTPSPSINLQETTVPKQASEPSLPVVKIKSHKEKPLETAGLVSLNCRLPAEIPLALLKASSERKMKKIRPFTQQDIIAEALTDWLTKNKFMS
jgi:hypothetical protein